MKKLFATLFLLTGTISLYAQNSVIQDGDGETSYQINGNLFTLNTANTSVGFTGTLYRFNDEKNRVNVSSSFDAKEGKTTIFSNHKLQFTGRLGGQIILNHSDEPQRGETTGLKIKHMYITGEVLYSKINVYDATEAFDDQLFIQNNFGFKGTIGYNWISSVLGKFSVGIATSFGIKDNSDLLEQDEITTTSFSQVNGTTTRTQSKTENAYLYEAIRRNDQFANINMDIGHYIAKEKFFANLHLLYGAREELKPTFSTALGFFFTKDGAPLEAIAGIQLQTSDWGNTADSELSTFERSALVLTVGFPFD